MTTTKTPDLQGLRQALLTPFEIVRDEQGCFSHPALPLTDEDVSARKFLSAFGIESAFVGMEDDCNDEALLESVGDGGSCAAWSPSTPSGDGWLLLAIYDTEEGPHALFARPAQAVEPTKRRRTAEAEPAPYGLPEFWAEAEAKKLTMADILPGVVKRLAEIEGTAPAIVETMVRFCPGCGSVGEVSGAYRDCCPDGSDARLIPDSLANKCRDLFQMALAAALTTKAQS